MDDNAVDLEPTLDAGPVVTGLSDVERNPSVNLVPEEPDKAGLGDMLRAKWGEVKLMASAILDRFRKKEDADDALQQISRPTKPRIRVAEQLKEEDLTHLGTDNADNTVRDEQDTAIGRSAFRETGRLLGQGAETVATGVREVELNNEGGETIKYAQRSIPYMFKLEDSPYYQLARKASESESPITIESSRLMLPLEIHRDEELSRAADTPRYEGLFPLMEGDLLKYMENHESEDTEIGLLDRQDQKTFFNDVAKAVDVLHNNLGYCHGNIDLKNVMHRKGHFYLGDFGTAEPFTEDGERFDRRQFSYMVKLSLTGKAILSRGEGVVLSLLDGQSGDRYFSPMITRVIKENYSADISDIFSRFEDGAYMSYSDFVNDLTGKLYPESQNA